MNGSEFQSSRNFADTPFGRIAYVERGSGPVALFVHGFPLCGYQWRHALDELSPVRTCIALDMMGLGYSEITSSQDISFESQAKMLAAFLQARSIKWVDLVANDTGAGISQVFLSSYPDHVRSVTLTNCEVFDLWPNAMLEQFFMALKSGMIGELLGSIVRDPSAAAPLAAAYEFPESVGIEALEANFRPFAESEARREVLTRFSEFERNRDQLVAAGRRAETFEGTGADPVGRGGYGLRCSRFAGMVQGQSGWIAQGNHYS